MPEKTRMQADDLTGGKRYRHAPRKKISKQAIVRPSQAEPAQQRQEPSETPRCQMQAIAKEMLSAPWSMRHQQASCNFIRRSSDIGYVAGCRICTSVSLPEMLATAG
jgi:hypothetical protein